MWGDILSSEKKLSVRINDIKSKKNVRADYEKAKEKRTKYDGRGNPEAYSIVFVAVDGWKFVSAVI